MSETVVLYPLTTVIQLVIVCLSCDFGLLILSPLGIVKEFILALSGVNPEKEEDNLEKALQRAVWASEPDEPVK